MANSALTMYDSLNKRWLTLGVVNNGDGTAYLAPAGASVYSTTPALVKAQALTDAVSIVWDMTIGEFATVTLGGNRTLAAPTGLTAGASYRLLVTQDATGGRTLAYNAVFKWVSGSAPTVTATANAVSLLTFVSDGTNLYGSSLLALA